MQTERGRRLGRIAEVLFHPQRAEVVGYVIERPRVLYLFAIRKDAFLARDRVSFDGEQFVAPAGGDAWEAKAARRLGFSWDDTVIWMGMPVRTESGRGLGVVRDGLFDTETGAVAGIGLSGGVTADLAVGTRDVPARFLRNFDGTHVVVADEMLGVQTDGGAAAAAGRQAAVAKQAGGELAKGAAAAAKTAAAYGASAAREVAKSKTGKKAIGWLKALKDEVVDAMGEPDDDD